MCRKAVIYGQPPATVRIWQTCMKDLPTDRKAIGGGLKQYNMWGQRSGAFQGRTFSLH